MKPASFAYHVPESLPQALELLHQHGDEAKILAGGQSLVPAMNFRILQPAVLIDVNRVPELNYIREDGTLLRIGAMTRERQLEFDALLAEKSPLLSEAAPFIAHPQIRNRGTIGGSLVNADPAAELPVLMLALSARLKAGKAGGERWIEARDFFLGMFTTALESDEMLTEIELPAIPPHTGWSFMEVAPRAGDYALMGIAALITLDKAAKCERAKLVYLNAGDGPLEAVKAAELLQGKTIDEALIDSAAALTSQEEIQPFGNLHASAEYQRHIASVLTRRALAQALLRAKERAA